MNVAKYAGLFLIAAGTSFGLAVVLSLISLKSFDLGVDLYQIFADIDYSSEVIAKATSSSEGNHLPSLRTS